MYRARKKLSVFLLAAFVASTAWCSSPVNGQALYATSKTSTIKTSGGTYCNRTYNGDLIIKSSNVTLKNVTVTGKLTIATSNKGITNLYGVNTSTIEVKSVGDKGIYLSDVNVTKILTLNSLNSTYTNIKVAGNTKINSALISSNAILTSYSDSFGNIVFDNSNNKNFSVQMQGKFTKSVLLKSNVAMKTIGNTKLENVQIQPKSSLNEITIEGNFKTIELKAPFTTKFKSATSIDKVTCLADGNVYADKNVSIKEFDNLRKKNIKVTGEGASNINVVQDYATLADIGDINIGAGESKDISINSFPADGLITAGTEDKNIATANVNNRVVKLNALAPGKTIVNITISKNGYMSISKKFNVNVTSVGSVKGSLDVTSTNPIAGATNQIIKAIYTLGETYKNGRVEFTLPSGFTASLNDSYCIDNGTFKSIEASSIVGSKVIIKDINASAGQKLNLTLVNKTLPSAGDYVFAAIGDADGDGKGKLPTSGESKSFKINPGNTVKGKLTVTTSVATNNGYNQNNGYYQNGVWYPYTNSNNGYYQNGVWYPYTNSNNGYYQNGIWYPYNNGSTPQNITLTYTVGENYSNGKILFYLPAGVIPTTYDTIKIGNGAAQQIQQTSINGQVLTISNINAASGERVEILLYSKFIYDTTNCTFRAMGDADGDGPKLLTAGEGDERTTISVSNYPTVSGVLSTSYYTAINGTSSITLTYAVGENYTNGSVQFTIPDGLTPSTSDQYMVNNIVYGLVSASSISGNTVTINSINLTAGQTVSLVLLNRTITAYSSNWTFKAVGDADGMNSGVKGFSTGNSNEIKNSLNNTGYSTTAGVLTLSPQNITTNATVTINATYSLGEAYRNGKVVFTIPSGITIGPGDYVSIGGNTITLSTVASGNTITLNNLNLGLGQQITITLYNKYINAAYGYSYLFTVTGDCDGDGGSKTSTSGNVNESKYLTGYGSSNGYITSSASDNLVQVSGNNLTDYTWTINVSGGTVKNNVSANDLYVTGLPGGVYVFSASKGVGNSINIYLQAQGAPNMQIGTITAYVTIRTSAVNEYVSNDASAIPVVITRVN